MYMAVKNYENRSIFVWVIEKIKVSRFLWPTVYIKWLVTCTNDDEQVSKGLWKKYGDGRVKDTPITEVCTL